MARNNRTPPGGTAALWTPEAFARFLAKWKRTAPDHAQPNREAAPPIQGVTPSEPPPAADTPEDETPARYWWEKM